MKCPLCCSDKIHVRSRIKVEGLVALWRSSKVDVSHLIKNDLDFVGCDKCKIEFYYPIFSGDDTFYSTLSGWDWYYKHPGKSEYFYASSLISRGDKVIDIGCGIGEFSMYMTENDYTGIELSTRAVEIARSMGRNVIQTSVESAAINFREAFDYVTCFQVLEHLTDLGSFFPACINLCKKGGRIILAVPNNEGFLSRAVNNFMNMPPHHTLMWNKDSLFFLASKYNLRIVDFQYENLQDVHRVWAHKVEISNAIRNLLGKRFQKVDRTFLFRFINLISHFFALLSIRVWPSFVGQGHSVIITLEK